MYPGRIDDRYHEELGVSLVDYICFRNSKSALQELRQWMGDVKFLEMLNLFAGSYVLLPPSGRVLALYYDYMAALAVKRIQLARRKKDFLAWSEQEAIINSIAKKTKRKPRWVYLRGLQLIKEFGDIKTWLKGMKTWNAKFIKEEPHENR